MANPKAACVIRTALQASMMSVLVGTAVLPAGGCDLLAAGLPCREGTDCASGDVCGPNARCIAVAAQDGGDLRDAGGGEPDADGGEPDPAPESDGGDADGGIPPGDAGPVHDAGAADGGILIDGGSDAGAVDGGDVIDAGQNDAGIDAGPIDAGPQSLADILGFNLDTVDLEQFEVNGGLESWSLTPCANTTVVFDSTTNSFDPTACGIRPSQLVNLPNLNGVGQVVVMAVSNLDIESSRSLRLIGDKPVVLVSTSSLTVDGEIDASGFSEKVVAANLEAHGAGGNDPVVCASSRGAAADDAGGNEGHGGGGAGHRDEGGTGATARKASATGNGGAGGAPITTPGLVGGCRGGTASGDQGDDSARGQGGAAGGAIHVVAKDNITGSGVVTVAGAGGTEPTEKKLGGGGGGSGGTARFTAGAQLFMGNLSVFATGGGGASAAWNEPQGYNPGREATRTKPVPLGGGMTETLVDDVAGRGGIGGSNWGPGDGTRDSNDDKAGGGGGGGAAGFIFVEMLGGGDCFVPEVSYPAPATNAACNAAAYCGDGSVGTGEECDLGPFNLAGDVSACGCRPDCTASFCVDEEVGATDVGFASCSDSDACDETSDAGAGLLLHCGETTSCSLTCTNRDDCTMVCGDSSTCLMTCDNVSSCNMLCEEDANCAIEACTNSSCAIWGADDVPTPSAFLAND